MDEESVPSQFPLTVDLTSDEGPNPGSRPESPMSEMEQFRPVSNSRMQEPASGQEANSNGDAPLNNDKNGQQHEQQNGQREEQQNGQQEEQQDNEEDADPAARISDFDWEELHVRYHEAMKKCHTDEAELMQQWENLMTYFRVWAESGHNQETDRTYSRLRTRMTYVQHSEDHLEKTRAHYVNVVKAFESALNLLRMHGLGG